MSTQNIIVALMAFVGILIAGIAVYVVMNVSSGLNMTQGIVLVAIAIIGLFIILGVIFVLLRNLKGKN